MLGVGTNGFQFLFDYCAEYAISVNQILFFFESKTKIYISEVWVVCKAIIRILKVLESYSSI